MPKVFISYAHEPDAAFASRLAARLRAAGIDPWLDAEQLRPGQRLNEELAGAMLEVDCAVFLMTRQWAEGNYGAWEIQHIARRDRSGRTVRRIGVVRHADVLEPPELAALLKLRWIDGETPEDEAFWELYCGIVDQPKGPREEWASRARALAAAPPVPAFDPRAPRALRGQARVSFFCDRGPQWNLIEAVSATPRHQLVFVAGEEGEAHDFFIARIEEQLRPQPPVEFVRIDWRVRPASRGEYLERIAKALGCAPADLARELQRRMRHQNLVLIHPSLDRGFDDDLLVSYYTEWIPDLLRDAKPEMCCKCIQPVEWSPGAGVVRAMRAIVKWKILQSDDEREALELIGAMERSRPAAEPSVVPALTIRLEPIDEADVHQLLTIRQIEPASMEELLRPIRDGKARTSYEILSAIDRFFASREADAPAAGGPN